MYYHCRSLKYVTYGKVYPPPEDTLEWMSPAYKWLGNYCGYFPQVWLSRSHSTITGIRTRVYSKKQKFVIRKKKYDKERRDFVLFGFDVIRGFPLSYEHWCFIMGDLMANNDLKKQNGAIVKSLNEILFDSKDDDYPLEEELADWVKSGCNLDVYLRDYVFKEKDQVVVPNLNLKSAKKIICRNEKQKKTLRKMGFIEDRIQIKNIERYTF